MQVGMDFGSLLNRFLVDLGPKLGAKLAPKSEEMGYQDDVKKSSKSWRRKGTQHADVLAPNNITILTTLTVLAAGWQYKAL